MAQNLIMQTGLQDTFWKMLSIFTLLTILIRKVSLFIRIFIPTIVVGKVILPFIHMMQYVMEKNKRFQW